MVSGGSDGIGLAMCHKLAREGFNICIVARNEEKMKGCIKDISEKCPGVQTMYIVADLSKMYKVEDYKATIADKLVDLDVAIVVANAGYGPQLMFEHLNDENLGTTLSLNVLHVAYLIRALSDQLLKRKETTGKKPALVVVSSIAANFRGGVYSSTKAFATNLAASLSFTMDGLVDVLCYEPGFVETKMVKGHDTALMIDPDRAADVCFRDLGRTRVTKGDWRHYVTYWLYASLPDFLIASAMKAAAAQSKEKALKGQ